MLLPTDDQRIMCAAAFVPSRRSLVSRRFWRYKCADPLIFRLRQRTGAGIVEIEVTEVEGDLRVAITQSPPSLGPVIPEHHRRQVLNALGISSPSLHVD